MLWASSRWPTMGRRHKIDALGRGDRLLALMSIGSTTSSSVLAPLLSGVGISRTHVPTQSPVIAMQGAPPLPVIHPRTRTVRPLHARGWCCRPACTATTPYTDGGEAAGGVPAPRRVARPTTTTMMTMLRTALPTHFMRTSTFHRLRYGMLPLLTTSPSCSCACSVWRGVVPRDWAVASAALEQGDGGSLSPSASAPCVGGSTQRGRRRRVRCWGGEQGVFCPGQNSSPPSLRSAWSA